VAQKQKILVIDDSKVIRMRVRDMLPKGNFEVLEAKDGQEGLNFIRQESLNLIMLDLLLPKISGWDVFQHIQSNQKLQSIPLVLMSGRQEEVTAKIPEAFKYFEFIEKSFEKKELVDAIRSAMKKAIEPRDPQPSKEEQDQEYTTEIEALNQKIVQMQAEINELKKQVAQREPLKQQVAQREPLKQQVVKIFNFVKQKLK